MYCIKEFVVCGKCGEDSTLSSVDYIDGTCSYECTECNQAIKLLFKDALVDKKAINFFYLKENGQLSYKCGNCDKKISLNMIIRSRAEIEEILKNAYEGVCENCKDDKDTKCLYCNKKIGFIHKNFYTDKKYFQIYCDKECYLKHMECEYY